jgi:hypothetical protein
VIRVLDFYIKIWDGAFLADSEMAHPAFPGHRVACRYFTSVVPTARILPIQ